jgi:ribosomal protein S18 acetylase RimI-like enzyme
VQEFYENAVRGIGLGGKDVLYTNAVVLQRRHQPDEIIGFVCAQFFATDGNSDMDLFPSGQRFGRVMYILTLGVKEEFRRIKLATRLLEWVVQLATDDPDCGAVSHLPVVPLLRDRVPHFCVPACSAQVYLHVIHYNETAMRFYEKNGFQRLRLIQCNNVCT